MTDTLIRPNYARVKQEAARLIKAYDFKTPPVDPIRISQGLGLMVIFVAFESEKQNISGFFDFEEQTIFVNRDEYPLRQTFTIAHELGHYVLHREWARSAKYRVFLRDQENTDDDPHEKEANVFAASLLVPRFMLEQYWKDLTPEQLSKLFAVSVPMIRNRLSSEYGI